MSLFSMSESASTRPAVTLYPEGMKAFGRLTLGEAYDPISNETPWLGEYADGTLGIYLRFVGQTITGQPVDITHRVGAPASMQGGRSFDPQKADVGRIYLSQICELRGQRQLDSWEDLQDVPCTVTLTQWGHEGNKRQGFKRPSRR